MYVFDATPLIYLATVDRLDVVALLDGECIVPDRVYEEVVTTGVDEGHPDARRIERAVEGGMFQRVAIEMDEHFERFADADGLSAADAAVLTLAHQRDATAVMDDSYGRDLARAEDVETRGTAYLVLSRLDAGHLTAAEALGIVDDMVDAGWYCSPRLYAHIRSKIDELR